MSTFGIILQTPQVRALVQENALERTFHDALFPKQLFRSEVAAVQWPANVGDSQIFTSPGLMAPSMEPIVPGSDPGVDSYAVEQWSATMQQFGRSIPTHMPTSLQAIVELFLRNMAQLGAQAGQSLNRAVRDRMFNAAEAGWTVCDGAQVAVNVLQVLRLNGFTKARAAAVTGSSQVRFAEVSTSNPLLVSINGTARYVVGYTPATAGDEYGPGTLTLATVANPPVTGAGANVTVADRDYVHAVDRSGVTFAGGGNSIDAIAANDLPTLSAVRDLLAAMKQNNVQVHGDGQFHAHIDPVSVAKLLADTELRQLLTACPDYYIYKNFAIGSILNTVFVENTENPVAQTVRGAGVYTTSDPIAAPLTNAGGVTLHRILFTGAGGCMEYYQDMSGLITEAGVTGKIINDPAVSMGGIEVNTDRVRIVIRAPLDALQQNVMTSWTFMGDWPFRTDAATGDAKRIKRAAVLIHGADA